MQKIAERAQAGLANRLPLMSSGRLSSGRAISLLCTALTVCAMVVKSAPPRLAVINVAVVTGAAKMLPAMIALEVSPEPPRK